MKKIIFVILMLIFGSGFAEKRNYEVDRIFVEQFINNPFKIFQVDSKKAEKTIKNYFKNQKYLVIYRAETDFNKKNMKIYFAIELYKPNEVYNAIKKGIFVREDGQILVYFDPDKGIYSNRRKIIDFERIGFIKNEVECFVIYINDYEKAPIFTTQMQIFLLDNELNNIVNDKYNSKKTIPFKFIHANKDYRAEGDLFINMDDLFYKEEVIYKEAKDTLESFRKAKAQGKAVKSAAVKEEFERLKRAGLVQE